MTAWMHLADQHCRSLLTPALVLDRATFDRNLNKMQRSATSHGVALRPHFKTHKCPDIAKLQIRAGAIGISCATVKEVLTSVDAGIDNILLTSPVPTWAKLSPLVNLVSNGHRITLVADCVSAIKMMAAAASAAGITLSVLLDVDGGDLRTGLQSVAEAGAMLAEIPAAGPLDLRGIQVYAGRAQHAFGGDAAKRAYLDKALNLARKVRDRVTAHKLSAGIVTGGGTGTALIDMADSFFTEIQAGSYLVMDDQYCIAEKWDGHPPFEQALFVMTTVISQRSKDVWTVDAGTKSFARDAADPRIVTPAYLGNAACTLRGDEFGQLSFAPTPLLARPELGERVFMSVPHCDPTMCLYNEVHHLDEQGNIVSWQIKR